MKKISKKFLHCLLALSMLILSAGALTACGDRVHIEDTDQFLETYVWQGGYGTDWLDAMLVDFSNQDWVKEKYPDFDYYVHKNADYAFTASRVSAGSANTIDLLFGVDVQRFYGSVKDGKPLLTDLTELVYNATVPGEDITVGDKMLDTFKEANVYYDLNASEGDEPKYFATSWGAGMDGLMYNATILEELGMDVPVTTDELIALCQDIKDLNGSDPAYGESYSIIASTSTGYWSYMFPQWWAQYEGVEGYSNYYNGISEGRLSSNAVKQTGRLESLKVIDTLLSGNNGYYDEGSNEYEYMEAQTNFIMGKGLFIVCGDWFSREMRDLIADLKTEGYDYKINFMRTPIISSIVDRTPSIKTAAAAAGITDDEMLVRVIEAVDKKAPAPDGVTQADYDIIKEARGVVYTTGMNDTSVIPETASAKQVAVDFLRYMATDRAQSIYIENTDGSALPYSYDLKVKDPELYNAIQPLQQSRADIFADEDLLTILPAELSFRLSTFGGLKALTTVTSTLEAIFNTTGSSRTTAEDIYQQEIEWWTADNNRRWNQAVQDARL